MSFEPKCLQFRMIVRAEGVTLKDTIELLEVAAVEGNDCFGFQHRFVVVEFVARWQRPEESAQPFYIPCLL